MNEVFTAGMIGFAEALGEALGRGVARGIHSGLSGGNTVAAQPARRGRPAKNALAGTVPAEKRCKADGCPNPARAKGLCSKHYQAERRVQTQSA